MKTRNEKLRTRAAAVMFCTLVCAPAVSLGASFDCAKAQSSNEKLICADPVLSADDDQLGRVYRAALAQASDKAKFKRDAADAWSARERSCTDKTCLIAWYADRAVLYTHARDTTTSPETPILAAAIPPRAPPPALEVSARQMYAAYSSNEISADQKYKGKLLAVSGTVMRVGLDIFGDPYVSLIADPAGYGYQTVDGHFSKSGSARLAGIKKGDSVTLTRFGAGMTTLDPSLDCKTD